MGDFLTSKHKDIVDRLHRRVELCRNHHQSYSDRVQPYMHTFYENQKQDNHILRDRWFNSKAKKIKNSKKVISVDTEQKNHQKNIPHANPAININNNNTNTNQYSGVDSTSIYTSTDSDPSKHKQSHPGVDLSVQIIQNINSQTESGQRIETNVTVSSTLKPMPVSTTDNNVTHVNTSVTPDNHNATSNGVECKQEENTFNNCYENNTSIDILDNEVQKLLETWERNGIPTELLNINFDCAKSDDTLQEVDADSITMLESYNSMKSSPLVTNTGQTPQTSTEQFTDSNTQFESSLNSLQTPSSLGYSSVPSVPQSALNIDESAGPAAKTLKQMAAQHQHNAPSYPTIKTNDPLLDDRFSQQRTDFSNYQVNSSAMSQPTAMYSYQQPSNMSSMNKQNDMSYAGTKPLTHYNNQPPSSLQQLQNQVRSQFNPEGMTSMHLSQSQHMQILHTDDKHMQISQSQEMQITNPAQLSAMQQQSITLNSDMSKVTYEQQMKMHFYQQKMRQEHLMKQRQAHMSQQMNRSDYMANTPTGYSTSGRIPTPTSPLQTMQNMVNQTNGGDGNMPVHEVPSAMRGPPQPSHMMMGRMGPMPQPPNDITYQQQILAARAPMNPAQQNAMARAMRGQNSRYTPTNLGYHPHSPSMNSEPINNARDMARWRMMNAVPRTAMQHGSVSMAHQSSTMMRTVPDGSFGEHPDHPAINQTTAIMQQQQQIRINAPQQAYPTNIAMMSQRPSSADPSGMMRLPMRVMHSNQQPNLPSQTASLQPSNSLFSQSPTLQPQSNFSLDFLDTAQNANTDFFDRSTTNTDFALFDEILGQ